MLITTALTDIFLWAPLFSLFTSFETCTGPTSWFQWTVSSSNHNNHKHCYTDVTKGLSRLIVVVQCMVCGLVYLATGIVAWNAYLSHRDEVRIVRHMQAMQQMERMEDQQLLLPIQ